MSETVEPFPDCGVCKGTGEFDRTMCPSCVWRRWFQAEEAAGNVRSLEEIMAERAEGREDE